MSNSFRKKKLLKTRAEKKLVRIEIYIHV